MSSIRVTQDTQYAEKQSKSFDAKIQESTTNATKIQTTTLDSTTDARKGE